MRKLFLISLFVFLPVVQFAAQPTAAAEPLKLDVKVFFGLGETTYVAMLETGRERNFFGSYQVGFGGRLRRDKAFFEVLFSFNRWVYEGVNPRLGGTETRVNSFELPFIGGYIPYKNPLFKVFLYAGYVNHFNTKIIVQREGESSLRLRPKADNLAIYQAIARFGTSFDVAMFNFDLNYSISLNSATSTSYRTGYHQVQFNLAYIF
jgi:hypothetical protein